MARADLANVDAVVAEIGLSFERLVRRYRGGSRAAGDKLTIVVKLM